MVNYIDHHSIMDLTLFDCMNSNLIVLVGLQCSNLENLMIAINSGSPSPTVVRWNSLLGNKFYFLVIFFK